MERATEPREPDWRPNPESLTGSQWCLEEEPQGPDPGGSAEGSSNVDPLSALNGDYSCDANGSKA